MAPSPAAFPPVGGSGNLVVSAARECSWTASTQTNWISLAQPTEGQGDGSVRYSVAANPQASPRTGTLTVGAQSTQISQEPAPCRFELNRRSFELGGTAQTATVEVSAPGGCAWNATSSSTWITIVEGAQGNGAGAVRFRVAANNGAGPRSGSLQVADLRVDVRQAAAAGPQPPPPSPGDCSYDVVPDSAEADAGQTDGSFAVQAGADCSWTATSEAGWLTIVAGASGSGPGQVMYRAAANTSTSPRTARVTVEGARFTLEQAGESAPPPVCSYQIDPTSDSVPAAGGTGRIEIEVDPPCAWSPIPSASWIEITNDGDGMGDGRVDYRVVANTSTTARTGTIQIGDKQFAIDQEGAPPADERITVSGTVRSVSGSCPNKTFRVDGRNIRTTSATDYDDGNCGDIRNNTSVRVTGIVGGDDVVTAEEVEF